MTLFPQCLKFGQQPKANFQEMIEVLFYTGPSNALLLSQKHQGIKVINLSILFYITKKRVHSTLGRAGLKYKSNTEDGTTKSKVHLNYCSKAHCTA